MFRSGTSGSRSSSLFRLHTSKLSQPEPPYPHASRGTSRVPILPKAKGAIGGFINRRSSVSGGTRRRSSNSHFSPINLHSGPSRPASGSDACCDKCDGAHETDACPIYNKPREDHADAWVNKGRKKPLDMGGDGGNFKVRHAKVVPQPGDGSCLFHSMSYGLGGTTAQLLRREIANFIHQNPDLNIADSPMSDWVQWDSQCSVGIYARRMAMSGWGGGIEMAACSRLKHVNVHVYEKRFTGFKRISCFNVPEATKTIHVLYQGGVHFDALVPSL